MLLLAHGKVIPPPLPACVRFSELLSFAGSGTRMQRLEERLAVRAALHSARQESGPGAAESREDAAARLR